MHTPSVTVCETPTGQRPAHTLPVEGRRVMRIVTVGIADLATAAEPHPQPAQRAEALRALGRVVQRVQHPDPPGEGAGRQRRESSRR